MKSTDMNLKTFRGEGFGFNINRNIDLPDLRVIRDYYTFDFNVFLPAYGMNLQRHRVWTQQQKEELILSILKGIQIPHFTAIQQRGDKTDNLQIIDGKQRLTTLFDFIDSGFPIYLKGVPFYMSLLPADCQREILGWNPKFNIGYDRAEAPISDAEKVRWFELINFTGTAQDAQHLQNLKKAVK